MHEISIGHAAGARGRRLAERSGLGARFVRVVVNSNFVY